MDTSEMTDEEAYISIVTRYGLSLEDIPTDQITERICIAALKSNAKSFDFIPNELFTQNIVDEAVYQAGEFL